MLEDQYTRTRLLIGDTGLEKLQKASVAIVGCGAVGSFAVEALARTGVGHFILIDFDKVAVSNINRQLFAVYSTIGKNKVDVAKARVLDIAPNVKVDTHASIMNGETASTILSVRPDFVIDAIDELDAKAELIEYLAQEKIPFVSSMGAALKTDASAIQMDLMENTKVDPMASNLRTRLRKKGVALDFPVVYSTETPSKGRAPGRQMGSLVTITGIFGLMLANEVIKFLTSDI